jgi:hypothetical protein
MTCINIHMFLIVASHNGPGCFGAALRNFFCACFFDLLFHEAFHDFNFYVVMII